MLAALVLFLFILGAAFALDVVETALHIELTGPFWGKVVYKLCLMVIGFAIIIIVQQFP